MTLAAGKEIALARGLLAECPECRKAFPPMHGGRIRRRRRHRQIVETWAFWCCFCETWWVVDVTKAAARRTAKPQPKNEGPAVIAGASGTARFSKARRASRVEGDQARRVLFLPKGLDEPVD